MNRDNNNTQPTFTDFDIPNEHWDTEAVQKWCKFIGIPEKDMIIIRNYKLDGFWLIFEHKNGILEKELKDIGVSIPSSVRILAKFYPPQTLGKWESPQDLLNWMLNRYGAPKPPFNNTATEMPLMGRDKVLQDIYNKVLTRYQISNRHRENQPLLVIAGAPGIGKTRILQHIGKYFHTKIESKLPKHQININISLGNASSWVHIEGSNPTFALCKRILHKYFAEGHHVPYEKFCCEIESMLKETITFTFCFSAIHDHLTSLDPTMQNQECLINFGIDEFQKCLFDSKDVVHRRSILKMVIQSISGLLVPPPNSKQLFFNIIFAGIILEDITFVIGESSIPYHFIPLRLLNLNEYMKISETILGTQKFKDNDIQRAIRFMGGWPRPLEILFNVIRNHFGSNTLPINYNTTDLLTTVEIDLNQRYPVAIIDEDLSPSIIAYSVTQKVIRPQDKPITVIHPQDPTLINERTFDDLQSNGLITITSDNKVFLPLIFLRRYTNVYNQSPLLNSLKYLIILLEKKSSWEEWENFNCYLETIKNQSHHLLSLMYKSKSYSLGEYYRNALFFPPILADLTFSTEVETLSMCSFPTNRCPENCDIDKQCQVGTSIIKNPLVDIFCNAKVDMGTTYFLGNSKHIDGSTATLKTKDFNLNNSVRASEHIEKKNSNKQQIKFIPIVYLNHFITTHMIENFEDQLKKSINEPNITEAIIVCRGTKNINNNEIQPHDGFYYPFQDFIYKLEE
ncbi:hypothetical protein DLAC_03174 [Tieghemostelium lacteum]|uniref:SAM domain-containing protein n=1 Tax=Tieghemostelium lacteum TaxID=361077 RepID=A0A152A2I5_TIELA|nr:hypothetical protein DLAC_03174 [Tieghemostelium lacteum]|eukprot:KYR00419.1 hypothetical protein DLAC_03174 [Tieghemostelium lacteum]